MIVLDPYRKIKKYAKIGAAAAVILIVAWVLLKNITHKPASQQKAAEATNAEKGNNMLDAIKKANVPEENKPAITPEEAAGKQQETTDTINKTNAGAPPQSQPVSPQDQVKSQQDMLNLLNAANKK